MKPSFLGIGVQKRATSWLHETLHAHPRIFTSKIKEIDFFTTNYDRGYEWYERNFEDADADQAIGETSPSYFYHPDAPARVHIYRPDMKIIAAFRDPVERAYSNHLHEVRMRHLTHSLEFDEGLRNNPCYVEQGRYATHFRPWTEMFPRSQILVLIFEDIIADPLGALKQVYDFLEVGYMPDGQIASRRSNESVAFKFQHYQEVLQGCGNLLRSASP